MIYISCVPLEFENKFVLFCSDKNPPVRHDTSIWAELHVSLRIIKTTLRLPRYIPITVFPQYESESAASFTDPFTQGTTVLSAHGIDNI